MSQSTHLGKNKNNNKIENSAAPLDKFAVCVDPMNSKRNNFYVLYPFVTSEFLT